MEEEVQINEPLLVDSCMWIELIRGTKEGDVLKKYVEADYDILVSVITISEVYSYLLKKKDENLAKRFIDFVIQRSFTIPVITEIALKAAEIRDEKKWGLGDSMIYATCLIKNAKLLTCDSDFKNEGDVVYIGK